MPSNLDIQKVIGLMGESNLVNLDLSLREVIASPAVSLVNSVAYLEPWELICYTWVTVIRRFDLEEFARVRTIARMANAGTEVSA